MCVCIFLCKFVCVCVCVCVCARARACVCVCVKPVLNTRSAAALRAQFSHIRALICATADPADTAETIMAAHSCDDSDLMNAASGIVLLAVARRR